MRTLSLWFSILLFVVWVNISYAREGVIDFTPESVPILNDELRKTDDKIDNKITDEGDASSVDFTAANLTTDGTWHDLDLSEKIPKGVKWAILYVEVKDDAAGSALSFRKNGRYNTVNIGKIVTQVVNVSTYADIIVQVDKNSKIEYMGSNLAFTTITIFIKGVMR